jgi:hypothetical protein
MSNRIHLRLTRALTRSADTTSKPIDEAIEGVLLLKKRGWSMLTDRTPALSMGDGIEDGWCLRLLLPNPAQLCCLCKSRLVQQDRDYLHKAESNCPAHGRCLLNHEYEEEPPWHTSRLLSHDKQGQSRRITTQNSTYWLVRVTADGIPTPPRGSNVVAPSQQTLTDPCVPQRVRRDETGTIKIEEP